MTDFDFDGADLGEPAWMRCTACGRETMRSMCFECDEASELAQSARAALARCRLPSHFDWATLDAPELLAQRVKYHRPIPETARRLLAAANAILVGPTGSGKTSFAVACIRARTPRCLFVSADELSEFGERKDELAERAKRTRLLLLDDLGTDVDNANNVITQVIQHRHNRGATTWITTGLSQSQLDRRYGEAFVRRGVKEAARFLFGKETA